MNSGRKVWKTGARYGVGGWVGGALGPTAHVLSVYHLPGTVSELNMDSSTQSPQELYEIGTITVPILRMQKLRYKKIGYFAPQGYPASDVETGFKSGQSGCSLQRSRWES